MIRNKRFFSLLGRPNLLNKADLHFFSFIRTHFMRTNRLKMAQNLRTTSEPTNCPKPRNRTNFMKKEPGNHGFLQFWSFSCQVRRKMSKISTPILF